MGATVNLNNESTAVDTGNDSIVIVHHIEGIPGGRTLDTAGFAASVIQAGHVVIKSTDGTYKPMPVSGDAYAAMPADHTAVGVVYASMLTAKPFAAIMVRGTVNEAASTYPVPEAVKTALPHIRFTKD